MSSSSLTPAQSQPSQSVDTPSRRSGGMTTKSLLACVVLGAACAAIIWGTRPIADGLKLVAPWIALPSPFPWYVPVLVAPLLVRRHGAALLAGVAGALTGFGSFAAIAGCVFEILGWPLWRAPLQKGSVRSRSVAIWAVLASVVMGLIAYAMMFALPEFVLLPVGMKIAALGARLGLGVVYGLCAVWIAAGLRRVGVDPQRRGRYVTADTDPQEYPRSN